MKSTAKKPASRPTGLDDISESQDQMDDLLGLCSGRFTGRFKVVNLFMDCPIIIIWTSPLSFLGQSRVILKFNSVIRWHFSKQTE